MYIMAATTDYLPAREADLLQWSTNFDTRINAGALNYGLTVPQAAAYTVLHDAFAAAYATANEPITRTPAAITTKNTAKNALIRGVGGIRELAAIVQAFPGTTDTERVELGLNVRDTEPTPIPPPSVAPGLSVSLVTGRTVKVRVFDALVPSSRSKPEGVLGASVYSYVGETAPVDIDSWKYEGSTTRTTIDVEFPATVANGSRVWLTAYWTNPRLESGPPCQPVSTNIAGGLAQAA